MHFVVLLFNFYGKYIISKTLEDKDLKDAWDGEVLLGGFKMMNLKYIDDDITLLWVSIVKMENLSQDSTHSNILNFSIRSRYLDDLTKREKETDILEMWC